MCSAKFNPDVLFGYGPRYCIGAALAKRQLYLTISELFKRFPDIELDGEPERDEHDHNAVVFKKLMLKTNVDVAPEDDFMKAIRISAGKPELIDTAKPAGSDVLVRVASSSICGSDLHLINLGWAEGTIMGHEFAGYTPDGTAVAVEPVVGCQSL